MGREKKVGTENEIVITMVYFECKCVVWKHEISCSLGIPMGSGQFTALWKKSWENINFPNLRNFLSPVFSNMYSQFNRDRERFDAITRASMILFLKIRDILDACKWIHGSVISALIRLSSHFLRSSLFFILHSFRLIYFY